MPGNYVIIMRSLFITARLIFFLYIFVVSTPAYSQKNDDVEWLLDKLAKTESASDAAILRKNIWALWHEGFSKKKNKNKINGAKTLFDKGEFEKAIRAYSEIIVLEPDYVEGWNKRATVKFLLGDFYGSLKDIEEVLKRQPRHFGAISGSGLIHIHNSNFREAYKSYKRLTEIDPHNEDGKRFLPMLENKIYGKSL